jgi:predicted MFS family arabinose efflux permease
MAADLAGGKASTVGVLQGGLLGGVLLARTFGGVLGQWLGWRAPYLVAGVLAVLLAVVLAIALPSTASGTRRSYPALLGTTLALVKEQPALRRSGLYQALLFGGFSAAWTSIALLLTGPAYRYGTGIVGVVALVGAASVLIVPMTGRLIDRRGPDIVNTLCFVGLGIAALVLLAGLIHGPVGLAGLIVGMLLMDVSVQSSQVANQARIFALVPTARSRLNSAYMTAVFLGGSAGSWVGVRVYLSFGWAGVCALVALAGLAALVTHISRRRELSVVDSSSTECRPEQAGTVIGGDHHEDCVAVDPA